MKTGTETLIEMLNAPDASAEALAEIFWKGHPPFAAGEKADCSHVSCRECWLAWLTTGKPPITKKGGSV